MKKVLSLILTLAMFISLIPAAFAAKPTEFTIDFTDVNTENLYVSSNKYYFQLTSKNGSEVVEHAAEGTNWSINENTDLSTLLQYISQPIRFYLGEKEDKRIELSFNKNRISGYNSKKDDYSNPKGDAVVFDFTVPADGYYAVTAEVYKSMYGGKGYFYINNEETRSYDFYNAPNDDDSYGREPYVEIPITSKAIYLNEGENQIKVRAEYSSGDGDKAHIMLHSFTFTPVENATVSFVQTTNVDGHNDITVKSVERGASVTLTAHAKVIPGYEFVGWKRGANDADSAWIDISGDEYEVWTNTFLTAIYKPVGETATAKTVDFWNQNGAYMGTAADETSFKAMIVEEPSLTGFGDFLGWFTDGNVELTADTELKAGTTNAVAQYEDRVVSGVTIDGEAISNADAYYNAPISRTKSGVTYWKRGGKVIAYGDTYNFNVWAGAEITSHTDAVDDKTPVAILEYNDTYKAYMLEYDDGDYEIVEAGILFGGNMTVDNCTNKYTSQRKVSHNQFTVPAEEGTAKGYIIWKNASGAYQIDYFSVAE